MKNRDVLISGAGIAGPSLAHWLGRRGFRPTVVERAGALRPGGNAVDFRGPAHLQVLREMGVLEAIRERQTHMRELCLIDAGGNVVAVLPAAFASGEVEIERGDLSQVLYQASKGATEYLFGDSIRSLDDTPGGVEVKFQSGVERRFDLVIGTDGLHSNVRRLAWGDEARFSTYHGYAVAAFKAPNHLGLDHTGLIYSEPGRAVSVGSAERPHEATVMLVFTCPAGDLDFRDPERQKDLMVRRYAGARWEVPRLIDALLQSDELYFDAICRIDVERLWKGRIALLGDAGYGATVGGQGTGVSVVGAYVLAGELAAAGGDHERAFARYHAIIAPYARGCQATAKRMGPFFAPRSRLGIEVRNLAHRVLALPSLSAVMEKMVTRSASDLVLPTYFSGVKAAA